MACTHRPIDYRAPRVIAASGSLTSLEQIEDQVVRELVLAALDTPWFKYWNPGEALWKPWNARGQCVDAADRLVKAAREQGFEAWRPQGTCSGFDVSGEGQRVDDPEISPEVFGYTDRLCLGYPSHYWACIVHKGRIWGVDLTAAQYGYSGPMVRSCPINAPEIWAQRYIWRMQLPPALTHEDIAVNRIRAGLDERALNPSLVQVWQHPDGQPRYAISYCIDEENVRTELPDNPDLLLDAVPQWRDEVMLRMAA